MALRLRQMELSAKTVYGPVLNTTQLSAHAQNHVSLERCRVNNDSRSLACAEAKPLIRSN